ncbi:AIG2-like protein C isoform X2 [Coffea arabica]|uniref:Putative gamma-glutamylcyclotransferase n=1 Tax=Coffea arabica TaxID=13443 RepID=A0A6P6T501_COFAR|nr:AIG2-like protein C isoform X2 [Coffea arabica]
MTTIGLASKEEFTQQSYLLKISKYLGRFAIELEHLTLRKWNTFSLVFVQVLSGITPFELHILDEFEDVEYERQTVDVYLMDSSEKLQVSTYVWSNKTDPKLYGEWDFEEWKRLHKEEFIKMSLGFMEELQLPESKPRVTTYESFFQPKNDGQS